MTTSHSQRAFFQITSQVAAYRSILSSNGARKFVSSVVHWFVRGTTMSDASIIPSFFSRQYARAARNESRESASRAVSRKKGVKAEKSICLRSAMKIAPVTCPVFRPGHRGCPANPGSWFRCCSRCRWSRSAARRSSCNRSLRRCRREGFRRKAAACCCNKDCRLSHRHKSWSKPGRWRDHC